jgi:formylglycine-generating enzyme required for sulfatase activity/serine/threonine protein kinase
MTDDHRHNIQADSVGKTACPKCGGYVDVSSEPAFSVATCPGCGARFTTPGKLGGFVLLKELGKGEMGATYKAYEKSLGRYVAIKVMHEALGEDPSRVESFMSEGRALASLDNPNIVRVFSLGQEKAQPYIVMELIAGGGMEKQFSQAHPLDEVRTLEIITGVARALRAANEIGLIHGDVKPENIMLSEKGRPKLVDFGIARFGGGKISEGDALGTPHYAAPEQVQRSSVDHRGDIYSLGATMYHALAGVPPFTGDSLMKVLYARIEGPVPDISETCPIGLHRETVEVLTRMLQKDPADRYATYNELLKDLTRACWAAGAEIIHDGDDAIPMAAKLSGPDWSKFRWPLVGLGVVMLLVGLWFSYFRKPGGSPLNGTTTQPSTLKVAKPVFSHPGGVVPGPTKVTIACNTPGAQIHYTTDKSEPTADSPVYSGAITVTSGDTLRARAFCDGIEKSTIIEAAYLSDEANMEDAIGIRAGANSLWEHVRKLDPGQGFGAMLEKGAKLHAKGSGLYDKRAYTACKGPYNELAKLCEELRELQVERQKAIDAQEPAQKAREMVPQAGSKWVKPDTRKSNDAMKQAKGAFDAGKFPQAVEHWKSALKHADAELIAVVARTGEAFENQVKRYKVAQLDQYGGEPWTQAKAAREKLRSAATPQQRIEAAKQCAKAIDSLDKIAKTAADAAKKAESAAKSAAKAAEIKKRFAEARKLMNEGRFRKALDEVIVLARLDGGNREVGKLKSEIEKKMRLSMFMGEIKIDNKNQRGPNIELAWIPAGEFNMGSPAGEKGRNARETLHKVKITKPFYMGVFEITRQQYDWFHRSKVSDDVEAAVKAFARAKGQQPDNNERNKIKQHVNKVHELRRKKTTVRGWNGKRWTRIADAWWGKPGHKSHNGSPVTCISWTEADAFCKWLSKQTGKTVRLPTEAEWEYACRSGTQTAFSFGDEADKLYKYANYADKASGLPESDKTHDDKQPVPEHIGRYGENPWKLKDMHGNVAEWCSDRWGAYRPGASVDPSGPSSGLKRIVRGGSWFSPPAACRSADRQSLTHVVRDTATGFRIVVELDK